MIRFINLGDQITDKNRFAFYDTITDKFCEFNGSQSWDNVADFKKDFEGDDIDRYQRLINHNFIIVDDIDDVKYNFSLFADRYFQPFPIDPWLKRNRTILIEKSAEEKIKFLEPLLKQALEFEDYLKADQLKLQIEALKNGLQSNS